MRHFIPNLITRNNEAIRVSFGVSLCPGGFPTGWNSAENHQSFHKCPKIKSFVFKDTLFYSKAVFL